MEKTETPALADEDTHAFTIRLPETVYTELREAAHQGYTSMNALLTEGALLRMHRPPENLPAVLADLGWVRPDRG